MSSDHFSLSWNSFKKNICDGFSYLQQKGEFVDMTLAADGHLVKVHQNLIALASPYLKEILQSIQCQHPVIFLSDVSHEILCYLLQYIYTGEVPLPVEKLASFLKAAKALKISGISNLVSPQNVTNSHKSQIHKVQGQDKFRCTEARNVQINQNNYVTQLSDDEKMDISNVKDTGNSYAATKSTQLTISGELGALENNNVDEINNSLPMISDSYSLLDNNSHKNMSRDIKPQYIINENSSTCIRSNNPGDNYVNSIEVVKNEDHTKVNETDGVSNTSLLYSLSNKGGLQVILNRFIYYLHHHSHKNQKKRWRCIDYRKLHCPAYVDTTNDIISNRKNMHSHSFHDKKIAKKIHQNRVFTTLVETRDWAGWKNSDTRLTKS